MYLEVILDGRIILGSGLILTRYIIHPQISTNVMPCHATRHVITQWVVIPVAAILDSNSWVMASTVNVSKTFPLFVCD